MKRFFFVLVSVLYASMGTLSAKDILITDFTEGQGNWTVEKTPRYEECAFPVWQQTSEYGMKATTYVNGSGEFAEYILKSPLLDLTGLTDVTLTFNHAWRYGSKEQLAVVVSNYGEWTQVEVDKWPTGQNWNFVTATVDLSKFAGYKNVEVAFQYSSNESSAPTWEIKDVSITGENNHYLHIDGLHYHLNKTDQTAKVMYRSFDPETMVYNADWNKTSANIPSQFTCYADNKTYTVIGIEPHAFDGCSKLTNVSLPNTIQTIGEYAFYLTAVQEIILPESVISIANSAFSKSSLQSFTFNNTITTIEYYTFFGCQNLANVVIPNQITQIGTSAFSNCKSLTQVVIPENVSKIGCWAFSKCSGLKQVTMKGTTPPTDGGAVFDGCSNLEHIYVPCGKLDDYKAAWPDNADLMEYSLVSSTPVITSFTGGKRSYVETTECGYLVTAIPDKDYYFANWTNSMTGINPPDNPILVRREIDIDNFVPIFMKWLKITKKTDTSMGTISGPDKGKLNESVTLEAKPNTTYFFVKWSDGNKDNPRTIELTQDTAVTAEFMKMPLVIRLDPESCKSWEDVYLRVWTDDKELVAEDPEYYEYFPEKPKNFTSMYQMDDLWYTYIFDDEMPSSMYIQFSNGKDKTVAIKNTKSPVCYSLKSSSGTAIEVKTVNCPIDVQVGDFGYTMDQLNKKATVTRLLRDKYYYDFTELDYTKFTGDLTIKSSVFWNSKTYTVTGISGLLLMDCPGITSLTIPSTVTYIGGGAFSYCTGLKTVSIPNSPTFVGAGIFSYCPSLKDVTLADGIKSISAWEFEGCSGLEDITIPGSVNKIELHAFYACSGLKTITCKAVTPPTCEEQVFDGETGYPGVDKTKCILFVPEGSVAAYKMADTWKEFSLIVPIGTVITDIEYVHPSGTDDVVQKTLRNGQLLILRGGKTYNAQGARVE